MRFCLFAISLVWLSLTGFDVAASDIDAGVALKAPVDAAKVCPTVCDKHQCRWSGEWKASEPDANGKCDCGPERVRNIPGGTFRTQEGADANCIEICTLQGDRYTGKWGVIDGGFSVCGCAYVADYCEPKF